MDQIIIAIIYGIVEGITEWLPISSTGHLILLERIFKIEDPNFFNLFLVVIQFGAILAVVIFFFRMYWPFYSGKYKERGMLWLKILVACIPAGIAGLLFDDVFERLFYNEGSVAIALILFGLFFIAVENEREGAEPRIMTMNEISFKDAWIIGFFQLISAIFPGTSRSGATILGGLLIGISRSTIASFTFIMAIPVMAGASLLKIVTYDGVMPSGGIMMILVGMISAFIVSLFVIRFLMNYIRKRDFKVFGYYRIVLGMIVFMICLFH